MGFEEFLPQEEADFEDSNNFEEEIIEKVNSNHVYDVITSKKPDWQAIIYELIHTEQLDPWDIDLIILTKKYFIKIEKLEETDFYISSKVLFAAALLLRIKSELLLNKHIKSIDDILFGKKDIENKYQIERIEIDESELPLLIPKTPMSRLRKVTLPELMAALNKAINTESRRIKREVQIKRARKLSEVDIPTFKKIDLKDRIKQFYARILTALKKPKMTKVEYSKIVGKEKEERLAGFLPVLHLNNSKKLWLEQENHLDEIHIYLYQHFEKNKDKFLEELEEDIEEMKKELQEEQTENIEPVVQSGLEKARAKLIEKKQLENEVKLELMKELGKEVKLASEEIKKEEKIDKITGFENEQ